MKIGHIGKAHGIRGLVTARIAPEFQNLLISGTRLDTDSSQWPQLTVDSAQVHKSEMLLAFAEITNRNQAEELRGTALSSEEFLPELEADTWYEQDLQGLAVRVGDQNIGKVTALIPGAAQDLLVIEGHETGEVLVPFVAEIVPEVEPEQGYIRVEPPPGLFEVNASTEGSGTDR